MKKIGTVVLLSLIGMSQAQSTTLPPFNPVYQKYVAGVANTLRAWGDVDRMMDVIAYRMEDEYDNAVMAGRAYTCVKFLESIIAVETPQELAKRTVSAGKFDGSYPQAKAYCEKVLSEAIANLPKVEKAAENIAYLGSSVLVNESGSTGTVESKVDEIRSSISPSNVDVKYLMNTLALDIYLARYPELKNQTFQRGTLNVGSGSALLSNSLKVVTGGAEAINSYLTAQGKQAQASNAQAQQEVIQQIKTTHGELSTRIAKGDKLMQAKQYYEAFEAYVMTDAYKHDLNNINESVSKLNVTGTVELNGKKVSVKEATGLIASLISTGQQKAAAAEKARAAVDKAIDAEADRLSKAILKGDRLKAFTHIGYPYYVTPNTLYFGKDMKKTFESMQKANTWEYNRETTAYGGFFCEVRLVFSGNKLVSRNISTKSILPEAIAYCQKQYTF